MAYEYIINDVFGLSKEPKKVESDELKKLLNKINKDFKFIKSEKSKKLEQLNDNNVENITTEEVEENLENKILENDKAEREKLESEISFFDRWNNVLDEFNTILEEKKLIR